jgi:hypothetical protein
MYMKLKFIATVRTYTRNSQRTSIPLKQNNVYDAGHG